VVDEVSQVDAVRVAGVEEGEEGWIARLEQVPAQVEPCLRDPEFSGSGMGSG